MQKRKIIGISLFIVSGLTVIVFVVSLLQPLLQENVNSSLILLVAALFGVLGFFSLSKDTYEFFQKIFSQQAPSETIEQIDDTKLLALPTLRLKLFPMVENRVYQDDITIDQSKAFTGLRHQYSFGLVLENETETTLAQGIDIRIECGWRGNDIQYAPIFNVHRRSEGWRAEHNLITHNQPAVLTFHGTNRDRCPYNHPIEWYNFSVELKEKVDGYFSLNYTVSSAQPASQNSGELKIIMAK